MLKKVINRIWYYSISIIFVIFVITISVFFYYGRSLPSELTLLEYSPPVSSRVYSADGQLMEEYAKERRVIISFERIPNIVKNAFLIAEDKMFYTHSGISIQSLFRAIVENTSKKLWKKRPAGGSTITQQVAKNILVGNEKSISRKIKEAIMAFRIESTISKDKILEIYLNHIYLGKGCYGVVEACNYYFGKDLEKITPEEAAFLAALPSAPSTYTRGDLKMNSKILLKRNAILSELYNMGCINNKSFLEAITKPISIKFRKNKLISPYFSDEIYRLFIENISEKEFFCAGYNITTTMDSKMQCIAEKCLEDGLIEVEKKYNNWKGAIDTNDTLEDIEKNIPRTVNNIIPVIVTKVLIDNFYARSSQKKIIKVENLRKYKIVKGDKVFCREYSKEKYEIYQEPSCTGGIVVMDANSGDILAMSGGYSFDISSFSCVTQAFRQPGSAIKPFVYAGAIESGMNEDDIIEDKNITLKLSDGKLYMPKNHNGKTYGKMQVRDGLIHSRNLATINLVQRVGVQNVSDILQKFGLISRSFNMSYVLGAFEVTLLQLVSTFSAFLNDGNMVYPNFIKCITNQRELSSYSTSIKKLTMRQSSRRIVSKNTAVTIKNILRDTAKYGTARKLAYIFDKDRKIDVGGKTGSTNDCKDAWFIGYVTSRGKTLIVGIFVGYEFPKTMGQDAYGAKIALPIFINFLESYLYNNK